MTSSYNYFSKVMFILSLIPIYHQIFIKMLTLFKILTSVATSAKRIVSRNYETPGQWVYQSVKINLILVLTNQIVQNNIKLMIFSVTVLNDSVI